MNRTTIEWVRNPDGSPGYTFNPITGCLNHVNGMCKGGNFPCYAYRLATTRLRERYLANNNITKTLIAIPDTKTNAQVRKQAEVAFADPFYPRFSEDRLYDPFTGKQAMGKSKGIFVCDMSDLFGIGIPEEWTRKVLHIIKMCPQHRFYLLTKQPQNLAKFSPFPDNCWVGVTVTRQTQFTTCGTAMWGLGQSKAKVKFLSFEPLLERISADGSLTLMGERLVDWVIIGAMTCSGGDLSKVASRHPNLTVMPFGNRYTLQPKIEWVREIEDAARKAGIAIFEKNSLQPLLQRALIQEFPQ